ncbi:hypothetical protein B0186_07535 [Canicola haemoglobinophilus]|uniref:Uncharacterized protein n=1 Tax=Canicola haemoglobinophilus TaxID=733 RepID=A0A1V4B059_9PAST|nr:hypothetical protein [Canicola haemoglobinophilus]OOR99469.1 hypothetical protein B0186_07535 [Canicola haemoglobinophilus]STO59751.1 Uncharacterised protein [Canicola haemoglobinophilus]
MSKDLDKLLSVESEWEESFKPKKLWDFATITAKTLEGISDESWEEFEQILRDIHQSTKLREVNFD